ncbi:DUF7350 domain-containing protein [Halomarina rubra]|uniref:Iron transporter n=1 Tax=Halomarina rubra TaxID=2071873 RepID=A0ABD6AX82_9EURY|nr:iron transporter [Halomarina rubra]
MNRRDVLRSGCLGLGVALAGCLGGFEQTSAWRDPPLVENRPQAVYVPAITEGMRLVDETTIGPYGVSLSYSYPHRFWNVASTAREKVVVTAEDAIHLMVTVWDRETNHVIPSSGVSLEIRQDEALVSQEVIYPMLSQQMGFHYGANFELEGEGMYEARVSVGGLSTTQTGEFEGRFDEPLSVEVPFGFDTDRLYELSNRRLGERKGRRDAIAPMDMGIPTGKIPDATTGTLLGTGTSGDAQFAARLISDEPRFGDDPYLAVIACTPYNRTVLPMMHLEASITTPDGQQTVPLQETLDPDIGYHYGTGLSGDASIDRVELTTVLPPQVARHDGYETAFFEMPPVVIDE